MSRNFAFVLVMVAGCGGGGGFTPADFSGVDMATGDGGGGPMDGGLGCQMYTAQTVAMMRQNAKNGDCVEIDNVVLIASHHSKNSPRIYVQDAAGGDFSAIVIHCSATSTISMCTQQTAVNGANEGDSVTIKGKYIKAGAAKGSLEGLYLDTITDNGAAAAKPPVLALTNLADIERGGYQPKNAYQKISITIKTTPTDDTLVMYDWTPSEFSFSGGSATCKPPYQFGFGMIPKSVPTPTGMAAPGMACTGTTAQPAGVAMPDSHEVLFGTDFYTDTWIDTSDCRCSLVNNPAPAKSLVTSTSTLSGALTGMLIYDTAFGTNVPYQYIAPQLVADAPIGGLM